jgi:hypothetical protein
VAQPVRTPPDPYPRYLPSVVTTEASKRLRLVKPVDGADVGWQLWRQRHMTVRSGAVSENHQRRENRASGALDLTTLTWICLVTRSSAVSVIVELRGRMGTGRGHEWIRNDCYNRAAAMDFPLAKRAISGSVFIALFCPILVESWPVNRL